MKMPLDRQCTDARQQRALPSLFRRIVESFAARRFLPGASGPRSRLDPVPQRLADEPAADAWPMPTRAELEALRWTMDGLTDREIGLKLGLPEREVALRVQRVMRKFGCGTRYEAGLRAIKLRLIEGL